MDKILRQAQDKTKIFKVSQFNELVHSHLKSIGEVVVEGEISELNIGQGKWLSLTIKDEEASVGVFSLLSWIKNYGELEQGMLVHVYGKPWLYKKIGKFSLFADQIVPAGEGALRIAFEKLKQKLDKEGLFAPERKRPLPMFPEQIGLITAKNSQAYSDFIKVLAERMGGIKIYFHPVQVQGKGSVESILAAINYFNKNLSHLDLLVLTRGGGSLEDLLSFNDEQVARAIFSSKIPIVCGVGHEGDFSLADLVADKRASTPSNAAELIVRHKEEVIRQIDDSVKLMSLHLNQLLKEKENLIYLAVARLKNSVNQKIRDLRSLIRRFVKEFGLYGERLERVLVDTNVQKNQLVKAVGFWFQQKLSQLDSLTRLLKSLDYRRVLARGFSITIDKKGRILKAAGRVKKNEDISSQLFNGKIYSRVFRTEVKK